MVQRLEAVVSHPTLQRNPVRQSKAIDHILRKLFLWKLFIASEVRRQITISLAVTCEINLQTWQRGDTTLRLRPTGNPGFVTPLAAKCLG
jgi:hypothetical protein